MVGNFLGSIDPGGGPLIATDGADAFVAKFNGAGAHLWSKSFGGPGIQQAANVTVDSAGNVYFAISTSTNSCRRLLKLSSTGTVVLDKQIGTHPAGLAVAVDDAEEIAVVGYFGDCFLPSCTLASAGGVDGYVSKYDSAGGLQWETQFGGAAADYATDVAFDPAGNVIVSGYFEGAIEWDGEPGADLTPNGDADVLVAKLDSLGNVSWVLGFGGTGYSRASDVDVDSAGTVAVVGAFEGTVDFGGKALISKGSTDYFVATVSAGGVPLWGQSFGSDGYDYSGPVAIDDANNVLIAFSADGAVNFGGGSLAAHGLPRYRAREARCRWWPRLE